MYLMKSDIDILIINNCPSFYKINLYNEINVKCKIHVVFLALTNQVVINESYKNDIQFSYEVISQVQIEKRNKWQSFLQLYKICNQYNYIKIIYGGYSDFEQLILMFLTPKQKNCLQFESSIKESKVSGIYGFIKKIFFNRISLVLPPGKLHSDVFSTLNFKGDVIETKGVGIFDKKGFRNIEFQRNNEKYQYIFVGRLIPVKNLEFLISIFNKLNKSLTIVGTGVLDDKLKKMANSNITFTGFINNYEIGDLYTSHDVFILPSISETWGLVVEEAIYFGLPVLVSNAVGCQEEMVVEPKTGLVFSSNDKKSLLDAICNIEANINFYRQNCKDFNFQQRDQLQVDAYLKILTL